MKNNILKYVYVRVMVSIIIAFLMVSSIPKNVFAESVSIHDETSYSYGYSWYYNTGEYVPKKVSYSRSGLIDIVQKGDIIYEPNGFWGLTGHMAIVGARRL